MSADQRADIKIKLVYVVVLVTVLLMTYWPSVSNGLWGDSLAFVHQCRFEGISCINPQQKWSLDSVDSYWFHRQMISEVTGSKTNKVEQYLPPVPQFFMFIQSQIFGPNFQFYHMFNMLLLIILIFGIKKLVLNLGGNDFQGFLTAFICSVHPAFGFDVSTVIGQTYLLIALFWLFSINTIIQWKNSQTDKLKLVIFLTLGLLCDSLMLSVIPVSFYLLYKNNKASSSNNNDQTKVASAILILFSALLIFFFYRCSMPWLSGSHSLEGWYQNHLFQTFLKPFGYWFNSISIWLTILPPQYWFALPLVKTLTGFLVFGITIIIIVRIAQKQSDILQFGIISALCISSFSIFDQTKFFNLSLISVAFALVTVDLITALYKKFENKIAKIIFIIVFVLASKLAIGTTQGLEDFLAYTSKTSDQYSSLLVEKLGNIPRNSRIYIFNFWSMAPLLPLEVELKLDRKDVNAYLMTPHAASIPYKLPMVDNYFSRFLDKDKGSTFKLNFGVLDKNILLIKAEKGVLFRTVSEINATGKFAWIPNKLTMHGNGFKVKTIGERFDGAPTGLQIEFEDYIMDPKNIFVVWEEGKWKVFNPGSAE